MIYYILLVLKIIGIVLLWILGIVLFLLLLILFVPIRYKIRAQKYEDGEKPYDINVKVTYLLHFVNALIAYPKEGEDLYRVRIMWFKILPKKKDTSDNREDEYEPDEVIDDEKDDKTDDEKDDEKNDEKDDASETFDEVTQNAKEFFEDINEEALDDNPTVKGFIDKVFSFIQNIKFKILNICDKIKSVFDEINYYTDILTSDMFKKSVELCKKEFLKLLRMLKPKKIKGVVEFGADTPDKTGQVMSYYSLIYPSVGKNLVLIPYFDRECFNGDVTLKGHLTVFTILVIAAKLYFNKDLKKTIRLLKKEND